MSDIADGERKAGRCSHLFHKAVWGIGSKQRRADCPLCRRSLVVVLGNRRLKPKVDERAPPLLGVCAESVVGCGAAFS
ncbi:hypothetical protein HPP92_020782 [Vanilla planifolia]|nr:hypothetical protein HPP92_020782 [Vanilla planifolia]